MHFFVSRYTSVFLLALSLFVISSSSCKKDKTCYGTVKVLNAAGNPLTGADVHLAAPSVGGQITYDAVTDANGDAYFEIKLPAIFDITATHASLPAKTGTGTLRCDEPGKKTSATVKII